MSIARSPRDRDHNPRPLPPDLRGLRKFTPPTNSGGIGRPFTYGFLEEFLERVREDHREVSQVTNWNRMGLVYITGHEMLTLARTRLHKRPSPEDSSMDIARRLVNSLMDRRYLNRDTAKYPVNLPVAGVAVKGWMGRHAAIMLSVGEAAASPFVPANMITDEIEKSRHGFDLDLQPQPPQPAEEGVHTFPIGYIVVRSGFHQRQFGRIVEKHQSIIPTEIEFQHVDLVTTPSPQT